ncbi:hypothetical protein [Furfurilactobacillus entadae]|uniref:hypothetical protein n=1 Tax=Furfurilactobacillus entadae TaxID=2922307 RepID=UPI0035EAE2EA
MAKKYFSSVTRSQHTYAFFKERQDDPKWHADFIRIRSMRRKKIMINASIIFTGVVIFSLVTGILNTKTNVQRASNTTVSSKTRSSKASDQSTTNSQARESIDDDASSDNAASLSSSSTETSEALKNSSPGNSSEADQSENSDSNDTYTNAYGHIVTKGQEDNSGMARRQREINSDYENFDNLTRSSLTYDQKITQMKAWGFTFRPAENNGLIIYGRDQSEPALGIMDKDGNIQKQ